jgi:hypothetical protein
MTREALDTSRPNVARTYDALLGGSSGFAADRAQAGLLLEICPQLRDAARDNRAFLTRAVTWAAGQGIAQFADLGAGIPVPRAPGGGLQEIHETARAVNPSTWVAYVDNDPVVLVHSQASRAHVRRGEDLVPAEGVAVVEADLREPARVLADPGLRSVIDPAQPVCLIFGLVLNLMPAGQAREVVAGYADLAAPGSCILVSCGRVDDQPLWQRLSEACTAASPVNHAPAEVEGFLASLDLVPPGLVAAQTWRGGWYDVPMTPPGPVYVLGGIARKWNRVGQDTSRLRGCLRLAPLCTSAAVLASRLWTPCRRDTREGRDHAQDSGFNRLGRHLGARRD